jgi:hypothetical protein
MPRFALLTHDSPRGLHYDLLLEAGDVLKTWAMPRPPEPGVEVECEALADHRPLYLDYEGPISGGRGAVARWDRGTFDVETWTDERILIRLSGEKLVGRINMLRVPGEKVRWRIAFRAATDAM